MKYGGMTKTARNQAVKDYHEAHPEFSLKEIGQVFRISKQRVSQIIKKDGKNK